jgi:bacterioferritin
MLGGQPVVLLVPDQGVASIVATQEAGILREETPSPPQGMAGGVDDSETGFGNNRPTEPRAVPRADQPREMLEQALAAEKRAIADYEERLRQADAFGDVGLRVSLENQVADETRHKEELERVLAGWNQR